SDSNFNGSTSATLSQVVSQANTTTAVSSSVNPSVFGQSVTLTATVSAVAPGAGTPSGTVTFKDGTTTVDPCTLNGRGVATYPPSARSTVIPYTTPFRSSDSNFNGSTSATLSQIVNKANTSTTLSSSVNPSMFGQSVTFTATVAASTPGAGTPSGTVTFKDGTTPLGTGTLNGSGVATLATSTL